MGFTWPCWVYLHVQAVCDACYLGPSVLSLYRMASLISLNVYAMLTWHCSRGRGEVAESQFNPTYYTFLDMQRCLCGHPIYCKTSCYVRVRVHLRLLAHCNCVIWSMQATMKYSGLTSGAMAKYASRAPSELQGIPLCEAFCGPDCDWQPTFFRYGNHFNTSYASYPRC